MKPNGQSCVLFDLVNTLVEAVDLTTWPEDLALPTRSIEHHPVGYESKNLGAEIKRHIRNAHSSVALATRCGTLTFLKKNFGNLA